MSLLAPVTATASEINLNEVNNYLTKKSSSKKRFNSKTFNNEELIREKYSGIRPAPGYPACPDHTEKQTIFKLLNAEENIGVTLTESLAMFPASSVSGWYFAHPDAKYFGLGKIKKDQVTDLAKRKAVDESVMLKWLAPNLDD